MDNDTGARHRDTDDTARPLRRGQRQDSESRGEDETYEHDPLTQRIIGCAIEVHRCLGPGLLEATYGRALRLEFEREGLRAVREVRAPVLYKGTIVGEYHADMVVEGRVVIEIKSVEQLAGLHRAQLLAYMRVLQLPTGLLLNFNGEVLRKGIQRLAL
jgi:GxxExxY protein